MAEDLPGGGAPAPAPTPAPAPEPKTNIFEKVKGFFVPWAVKVGLPESMWWVLPVGIIVVLAILL